MTTEWLNLKAAAEYIGITPAALRARISRGLVPDSVLHRLGRNYRFARHELDAWIRKELNTNPHQGQAQAEGLSDAGAGDEQRNTGVN